MGWIQYYIPAFLEFSSWFHSICDDIALQSIQVHQAEEYPILPSLTTIKELADSDADSDCGNSVESVTSITSEMISEIGSEFQSKVRS